MRTENEPPGSSHRSSRGDCGELEGAPASGPPVAPLHQSFPWENADPGLPGFIIFFFLRETRNLCI